MAKICETCGEKMKLCLPIDGFISLDTNPPMYPYEWKCKRGHALNAGYMSEDKANALERVDDASLASQ